jgi:hypothetical protein
MKTTTNLDFLRRPIFFPISSMAWPCFNFMAPNPKTGKVQSFYQCPIYDPCVCHAQFLGVSSIGEMQQVQSHQDVEKNGNSITAFFLDPKRW